jgi:hypothetical protein
LALHPSPDCVLPSSHSSCFSTAWFPQTAGQSPSVLASAPFGQQPSGIGSAVVIGVCVHFRVQALPASWSAVHAMLSLHAAAVGQLPSQSSPGSIWLLPHLAAQSLSLFAFALGGQH